MLEPKAREQSLTSDLESLGAGGPRFDRLRSLTEAAAERGAANFLGGRDDAALAGVLPLDSAKTFVGPNGTYYDESWRLMEWRGNNHSWNWAAALTLGGWLAYRRLYGYALLHFGWLTLVLMLAANGTSIQLLALLQAAVALSLGLYGNMLYRSRVRNAAAAAAQHDGDHPARLAVLAAIGGIDSRAAWTMGLAMIAVTALIVTFGKSMGGAGFTL